MCRYRLAQMEGPTVAPYLLDVTQYTRIAGFNPGAATLHTFQPLAVFDWSLGGVCPTILA